MKEDFPNYNEYLKTRETQNASTTRREYYKDIFLGLDDEERRSLTLNILDDLESIGHPHCTHIRELISGTVGAPSVRIPIDAWNAALRYSFPVEG